MNNIFEYDDIVFQIFSFLEFDDVLFFARVCSSTLRIGKPLFEKLYQSNQLYKKWYDVHRVLKKRNLTHFGDIEYQHTTLISQDFDPLLGIYIFLIQENNYFMIIARTMFRSNYRLVLSSFTKIRDSHYSFANEKYIVHYINVKGEFKTIYIRICHRPPHLYNTFDILTTSEPRTEYKNLYHYDKFLCFECFKYLGPVSRTSKPSPIGSIDFSQWTKNAIINEQKAFTGLSNGDGAFVFRFNFDGDLNITWTETRKECGSFPEFFTLVDNFRPIESEHFLCVPTIDNRWIKIDFKEEKFSFIEYQEYPVFSEGKLFLVKRFPLMNHY